MKTVLRWAGVYLLLLVGLTALGHYNQRMGADLQALQALAAKQGRLETALTMQRYELISPLAMRQWAEANGFIPMSLANWERAAP